MAIFVHDTQVIGRSDGRCVVAAAAYRAGERMDCDFYGMSFDYSFKSGVTYTEILLPETAPEALRNRAILWNTVENMEIRKDAQLAREIMIALPLELSPEENIKLAREYADYFRQQGMCVDLCIEQDDRNPHAHLLTTMRTVSQNGFGKKEREWNLKYRLYESRKAWEEISNKHLEKYNASVDCRSYEERGIERPVPKTTNQLKSELADLERTAQAEILLMQKEVDRLIDEQAVDYLKSRKLDKLATALKPTDQDALKTAQGALKTADKLTRHFSPAEPIKPNIAENKADKQKGTEKDKSDPFR